MRKSWCFFGHFSSTKINVHETTQSKFSAKIITVTVHNISTHRIAGSVAAPPIHRIAADLSSAMQISLFCMPDFLALSFCRY
jgi:hypothetical protein